MRIPYYNLGRPTSPDYLRVFPNRQRVIQPLIKVVLRYQQRKHRIFALVDSGADFCLFPKDVADILGIQVRTGDSFLVTGIGGGRIPFFFHDIEILLDKHCIKTKVGFAASSIGTAGLLGQQGFFEHFVVTFDYTNNYVELKKPGLIHNLAAKLSS